MDGSGKIAVSIVVAAALLAVTFIGYREFARQRDIADAQAAIQHIQQTFADASQQGVELSQAERQRVRQHNAAVLADQQRARMIDLSRRSLASDQRCVDGVVVQVDGSTYTQLGSISNPVHCSGTLADRAIR